MADSAAAFAADAGGDGVGVDATVSDANSALSAADGGPVSASGPSWVEISGATFGVQLADPLRKMVSVALPLESPFSARAYVGLNSDQDLSTMFWIELTNNSSERLCRIGAQKVWKDKDGATLYEGGGMALFGTLGVMGDRHSGGCLDPGDKGWFFDLVPSPTSTNTRYESVAIIDLTSLGNEPGEAYLGPAYRFVPQSYAYSVDDQDIGTLSITLLNVGTGTAHGGSGSVNVIILDDSGLPINYASDNQQLTTPVDPGGTWTVTEELIPFQTAHRMLVNFTAGYIVGPI